MSPEQREAVATFASNHALSHEAGAELLSLTGRLTTDAWRAGVAEGVNGGAA